MYCGAVDLNSNNQATSRLCLSSCISEELTVSVRYPRGFTSHLWVCDEEPRNITKQKKVFNFRVFGEKASMNVKGTLQLALL